MIKTNKDETIVGISFLLALFTPHIGPLLILNPLLILFLAYKYSHKTNIVFIKILICVALYVSFMIFITSGSIVNSDKSIFRTFYLIEMFLFFPFVAGARMNNKYLYISICVLFFSQLVFFLNVYPLMSLINTYYPYDKDIMSVTNRLAEYSSVSSKFGFRFGGMFNPNATSRYITLITIIALIENNLAIKKIKPLMIIATMGILLAGSRTGMLVFFVVVILSFYLRERISKKMIIVLASVCAVGAFIYYMQESDSMFRIFKVTDGLDDSIGTKLNLLLTYILKQNSISGILFGLFDYESNHLSNNGYATDFEWGDMLMTYGFIFTVAVIVFYIICFRIVQNKNRLFFVILLWSISGTILMHYRMSFIFMLLLSKYFNHPTNLKKLHE